MKLLQTLKLAMASFFMFAGAAQADWSDNAIGLGYQNVGTSGSVTCPGGGAFFTIWGTYVYTSDSSICTAAVHAGYINSTAGGVVQFTILPGRSSYDASAQNGVTSQSYGEWGLSFQITGAQPTAGYPVPVDWTANPDALGIGARIGEMFFYACPPGVAPTSTIWGTDVYTSDSAICVAAQHRGLIAPGGGGVVRILILGPQHIFVGGARNGVSSSDYPSWDRSYVFQ